MCAEGKLTDVEYLPLSCSQMNIWNLEMAHPGLPINNICTALKIEGNLNLEYLQTCIELVYRAFPSLRTRITIRDGQPYQYVTEEIPARTAFFDFTETNEQGVGIWFQSVAREHFTLYDSPLCQMVIFKTSGNSGGILTRVHHIIADAWSHALITNYIIHNYFQLLLGGRADSFAAPSYEGHILSEQKYLKSKAFEKDKKYWSGVLSDILPAAAKEYQCPVISPVGLRKSYRLSNRLNRLIGGFCSKNKVSPFAVFYMGLAVYLRRMKGQERFCVGVPTINRLNFQDKQTGGMFVNTLPFVNELDISMTWNEFNEKLQDDWFALLCHQRIPFESIKKIVSQNGRNVSDPLFDIVLSYQNGKMDHLKGARVSLEGRWLYSGYQSESLCIHLSSRDQENQYTVDYDYLTQIFSEEEIDRLHESLSRILKEALQNPDVPIAGLQILSEEMEEQVIYGFNQTDVWYNRDVGIADQLSEIFRLNPGRAAVIFEGRRISYQVLEESSRKIACGIAGRTGAGKGTVAVHMRRSEKIFTALCGIILSGNSWLLIDIDLPGQRKREMVSDSQALFCICTEPAEELSGCVELVLLEELADVNKLPDCVTAEYKAAEAGPDDLAYLVYTSGSTGTPKAVEVEQHSVLNLAAAMQPLYPKGAVLAICSVGFDAFLLESVIALLCGRTVVLASEAEMNHPQRLGSLIQNYDAGFMALTPSRLSAYLKNADFCASLVHMETVICGGESLPSELSKKLADHTSAALYNQYGPSEAAVAVSHDVVNGRESVHIGRPLQNCRIYILDEFQNPLPPGSVGELYIAGDCLARGYHNREELTKERFMNDPFRDGGRMYRTGDFGKWSKDGKIFYLGRRDDQVKLLGHRVELSEIESVLMRHEKVETAAAGIWENRLIAYYTGDALLTESELLTFAANYLPRYLLPAAVARVDAFPLNNNGKIDFTALEKPVLTGGGDSPADEVEEKLLAVWRKVLEREELDVHSDYFMSGGDSLNAVLMLLEVEKQFSRSITVQELYANATLRRLGNLIRGREIRPEVQRAEIRRASERNWYPVTPSQAGFYVMHQLDETKIGYNMPTAFHLSEWLDYPRLERAFVRMIEEDTSLRTTFHIEDGRVIARVSPGTEFRMQWMECGSTEEAMAGFVRPFDLTEGPLLRAAMLKLPDNEPYLLLDMHHIISDGLSSQLLLGRLNQYYQELPVSMPELDYIDYAWWVSEKISQEEDPCRAFWRKQLPDKLPERELTPDRPRPPVFDGAGGQYEFDLSPSLSERVAGFCEEQHVTPFVLLLAVYGLFLSRYSGSTEVVAGTPFSGRRRQHMEEMTGVFVQSLPVFMQAGPKETFTAYLDSVKQTVSGMLDHQEITLEELLEIAKTSRTRDRNPLFSVMFTMTPLKSGDISIGNAKLNYIPGNTHAVKMDLNLEAVHLEGRYHFRFEYARSLFDEVTIAFYSRCYLQGLKEVLRNPEALLSEFTMLDKADQYRLLDQPVRLRTPYDATTVDQAADYYAYADPERTAVHWGNDSCYSFGELKEKTDVLAGILRTEGIGLGDKVAFLTKRTGLLPVFMFGILKAGAAYVPIDPEFPKERILYMLTQADVRLVLYGQQELVLGDLPCRELVWDGREAESVLEVPAAEHGAQDAANVIFTSGTTGKPKGVVMCHKSLSNLLAHLEPLLGGREEKILCASNCVFDVFTTETILALGKGYAVSVADEEEMLLPWKMAERILRDHVTVLQLTPSRIQMCLGDEAFCRALRGIHRVILLGEPWSMELKDRLNGLTDARIFNIYGPTETSVHNCQGDITDENSIHIGKPIGNCRYYLLDEERRPVPPTAVGEIYIAGECLSPGYINRQDLTDQVFLPDPYIKGEKMYRTGDRGRLRADGNWQCLGRVDTQIKLNGHRIEPLEIAQIMLQSGLVKEAAAVPVLHQGAVHFLRAAVVKSEGYTEELLRAYMKKKLPDYMIPSEIQVLEELPRTASGKTDLKKLAETEAEVHEAGACVSGIAELWKEVLGREPLRDVSFFEQGGTSLQAILILNRYHQKEYDFGINDFYRCPTLGEQEKMLCVLPGKDREQALPAQKEARWELPDVLSEQEEKMCRPGNILLTGCTGYLGSYILKKLLEYGNEEMYCLVRGGNIRLEESMNYYFGAGYLDKYKDRIHAFDGELTADQFGADPSVYEEMLHSVTRVFHCAADVRHYAPEEELISTNVEGTRQVLRFAEASKAAVMHISTISVAGMQTARTKERGAALTEKDLDIGQNWWENPYVKSKIMAEKLVDDAVRKGLGANIFRIGRLVGSSFDGKFQKNPESNAFYRLVKGMIELGMLPEVLYHQRLEVTPVNLAAEAVVRLSKTTKSAYHICSPNEIEIGSLAEACGPVQITDAETFAGVLVEKSMQSDSPYIQALAQTWFELQSREADVEPDTAFSQEALAALDFWWPKPDLRKMKLCFTKEEGREAR